MLPALVVWGLGGAVATVSAAGATAASGAGDHVTLIVGLSAAVAALGAPALAILLQRRPPHPGPDPMTSQLMQALLDDLDDERAQRRDAQHEAAELRAQLAAVDRRAKPRPRPPR